MKANLCLNGAVKRVEAKTISLFEENGETVEKLESTIVFLFDEAQNLIETLYSNPQHNSTKRVNKFDSNNRKIKTQFFQNEVLQSETEYLYNSHGQEVEQRFYDAQKNLHTISRSIFTDDGKRIEETDFSELISKVKSLGEIGFTLPPNVHIMFSGGDIHKLKEIFNDKNNLIEKLFYNHKNKVIGKIFVEYNANHQPTEVSIYGSNSNSLPADTKGGQKIIFPILESLANLFLSSIIFFRLCFRGKFKKAFRCLIHKAPFSEIKIQYDNQGRKIEEKSFLFLKQKNQRTFKYDDKGNQTENFTKFDKQMSEYKYDEKNNWIEQTVKHRFSLPELAKMMDRVVVTYRKIEYFD